MSKVHFRGGPKEEEKVSSPLLLIIIWLTRGLRIIVV